MSLSTSSRRQRNGSAMHGIARYQVPFDSLVLSVLTVTLYARATCVGRNKVSSMGSGRRGMLGRRFLADLCATSSSLSVENTNGFVVLRAVPCGALRGARLAADLALAIGDLAQLPAALAA